MSVIGELLVEINGDNSGLKKSLGESGNAVTAGIGKMVSAIGLASLAWKAVDLAMQGIDYNKAAEQAEIAFGSFLGSASAAKDMIEKLRDLAKETPLEFSEVRDAAKQLSAFGISAENLIPTMRMLADVSAGLNIPVKDLSYLYGTIQTQGKAMTVDLMQFANRGIPIWEELSKVTGKSNTELRKMVEAGQIGFPQIEQAFKNMTSQGGDFFNMAVKQMDSLAGSQSNLNDAIDTWLGHITSGLTGPLKEMNKAGADILNGWVEIDKQWFIVNAQLNAMRDHFFGIKRSAQEIRDDAFVQVQTWDMMTARGEAFLANQKKIATETANASAETKKRNEAEEAIKQEYSNQLGFIANIIQSSKDLAKLDELRLEENANAIKDVYAKQLDYIAGVVSATKDQVAERERNEAKESTARQIVLGYQNQAINNQITANDLEEEYLEVLKEAQEKLAVIVDAINTVSDSTRVVSALFRKLGNDDMASLMDNLGKAGKDIGKLFASGGSDIGAWVGLATTAIDAVGDTVLGWFGVETSAQKKAREERAKAEAEYESKRAQAAEELNQKYEDYGKSQAEIAKSNFDKEMAYAAAVGASVATINKIKQAYADSETKRLEDIRKAELEYANKQKDMLAARATTLKEITDKYSKYESDRLKAISDKTKTAAQISSDAVKSRIAELEAESIAEQSAAEKLGATYEDRLLIAKRFETLVSEAFNAPANELAAALNAKYTAVGSDVGKALTEGLKSGATKADFRTSIMEMLRNMAIEAAMMASGFTDAFKSIGKMISEAMVDGLTDKELINIDLAVGNLYTKGVGDISKINSLFNRAESGNIRSSTGATVNVFTTSDALTIANAVKNVQESLAYTGAIA